MSIKASPQPWQQALGKTLARAVAQSRLAHAPFADTVHEASIGPGSRWRLPARPLVHATHLGGAMTELLGVGEPGQHDGLVKRCLQHYRTQLAVDDTEDDLGRALAAYLGACRQALDEQPFDAARWQAVTRWLEAWVIDELPWDDAPLAQRQDAFERFAVLAVALGEWTVQASRQGKAQQASAVWMARNSLRGQLGLDLPALSAALGRQDLPTAVSPSAAHDELGAAAYRQAGPDAL